MASSNDMVPLFRQLGLSNYESRVWHALLERGEADAQELVKTTGVPFGRIYDILNALVRRNMIEVQETRPKRYRPKQIANVIDQLLRSRRVSMDAEYNQLEEAGEAAKKRFAELSKKIPKDDVFVSVALCEQDIRTLLRDLEISAEKEIIVAMSHSRVSSGPESLVEEAANRLFQTAARGVTVKMLFAEQVPQIPPSLKDFETALERTKGRFQVRVYPGALNHFKVIDKRYVAMEVVDPYEPDARVALVQVLSKKLADHMTLIFDRCWRDSVPLKGAASLTPGAKSL